MTAPAVASGVVASPLELITLSEDEPWRVRVTERGEAAVLGRWREHLDDCAIFGLWCSPRRVPLIVTDLLQVARDQGFGRLVGPLVPEREAAPYLEAGLRVVERVVVMRMSVPRRGQAAFPAPAGVSVREATASDLDGLLRLDAACFEPFWRYDRSSLTRLLGSDRVAVGVLDSRIVGYTLSTSRGGDGSLGRLAVAPAARRRGVGRMLAEEAVSWLAGSGARRLVLSTQEGNAASRALYASMGFGDSGDRLVACASGVLPAPARA